MLIRTVHHRAWFGMVMKSLVIKDGSNQVPLQCPADQVCPFWGLGSIFSQRQGSSLQIKDLRLMVFLSESQRVLFCGAKQRGIML